MGCSCTKPEEQKTLEVTMHDNSKAKKKSRKKNKHGQGLEDIGELMVVVMGMGIVVM